MQSAGSGFYTPRLGIRGFTHLCLTIKGRSHLSGYHTRSSGSGFYTPSRADSGFHPPMLEYLPDYGLKLRHQKPNRTTKRCGYPLNVSADPPSPIRGNTHYGSGYQTRPFGVTHTACPILLLCTNDLSGFSVP